MTQHTKGPWEVGENESRKKFVIYNELKTGMLEQEKIAQIDKSVFGNPEANARLIAAAPELLEALEDFVSITEGYGAVKMKAVAAIAKAKAKQVA